MKPSTFIAIVIASLCFAGLYFFIQERPTTPAEQFENFPDTSVDIQQDINIGYGTTVLRDGTSMVIPDLREIGTNLNADTVEFSGDVPQLEKDFNLTYYEPDDYFIVSLENEPLAEVRVAAESMLMQQLGISREQLCLLNASVMTRTGVNAFYAGRELGFSNCPNSVTLQ